MKHFSSSLKWYRIASYVIILLTISVSCTGDDEQGTEMAAISISTESLDFGEFSQNQESGVLDYQITGVNITADIIVSTSNGLLISAGGENNFQSSITIESSDFNNDKITVYVKFIPDEKIGEVTAEIIHNSDELEESVMVSVVATVLEEDEEVSGMTGITGLKDTSRLIKSGSKLFCYATGGGIKMRWTSNPQSGEWNSGPDVFLVRPEWWSEYSPINIAWAPDVIFDETSSEYRLYYCISRLGSNTSAIGLAVNETLDPDEENYQWIDKGIVISTEEGVDDFNALDPCPIQRSDGAWFLSFGSHWGGIKLLRLYADGKWHPNLAHISDLARKVNTPRNKCEAPAIYPGIKERENGFWLFVNWGTGNSIENGEDATYEVRMGWSTDIRGPYLDKEGKDMYNGGGTVFTPIQETFEWDGSTRIGRGHIGIIKNEMLDGTYPDWVSYSYWLKNPPTSDGRMLGIQRLTTDSDGWPRAGELFQYSQ